MFRHDTSSQFVSNDQQRDWRSQLLARADLDTRLFLESSETASRKVGFIINDKTPRGSPSDFWPSRNVAMVAAQPASDASVNSSTLRGGTPSAQSSGRVRSVGNVHTREMAEARTHVAAPAQVGASTLADSALPSIGIKYRILTYPRSDRSPMVTLLLADMAGLTASDLSRHIVADIQRHSGGGSDLGGEHKGEGKGGRGGVGEPDGSLEAVLFHREGYPISPTKAGLDATLVELQVQSGDLVWVVLVHGGASEWWANRPVGFSEQFEIPAWCAQWCEQHETVKVETRRVAVYGDELQGAKFRAKWALKSKEKEVWRRGRVSSYYGKGQHFVVYDGGHEFLHSLGDSKLVWELLQDGNCPGKHGLESMSATQCNKLGLLCDICNRKMVR